MKPAPILILATIGLLAVGCSSERPPAAYGSGGPNSEPRSADDLGRVAARSSTGPGMTGTMGGGPANPYPLTPMASGPGGTSTMTSGPANQYPTVPMAYGPGTTRPTQ
jgi:hypothetical protein